MPEIIKGLEVWKLTRDVNTGFLTNQFSIAENRFQTSFWFCRPS